jgi:hypothetical protein
MEPTKPIICLWFKSSRILKLFGNEDNLIHGKANLVIWQDKIKKYLLQIYIVAFGECILCVTYKRCNLFSRSPFLLHDIIYVLHELFRVTIMRNLNIQFPILKYRRRIVKHRLEEIWLVMCTKWIACSIGMYFFNWTFSFITSMLEIYIKKILYCILIIGTSRPGSWFKHGFRFEQIL